MNDLHEGLAHLAFLVGTWRGSGVGVYPTIETFEYREEVVIGHIGKPFLTYAQRTTRAGSHPEAGVRLHSETGYIRPAGATGVELVVAQPTGIVEIHEGRLSGTTLEIEPRLVATTATAVAVSRVERRVVVSDDEMRYELWMEAVGQPHQIHLEATLTRRDS
ncbi:MAG TPA: FABP family protein [Acidimicrobiia bacterium]|jgi:hypothetical protein